MKYYLISSIIFMATLNLSGQAYCSNVDPSFTSICNIKIGANYNFDIANLFTSDLDNNQASDIVISYNGLDIGVLLNSSTKGVCDFQTEENYVVDGSNIKKGAHFIAIGDLNGDGNQDVGVPVYGKDYTDDKYQIFYGKGGGTLNDGVILHTGDKNPVNTVIDDFDKDGRNDFAVSHNNGGWTMKIFLQKTEGQFTMANSYSAGQNPHYLARGDFNGDTWPDIAAGAYYSGVFQYLNAADETGAFAKSQVLSDQYHQIITVADFDNDGYADVAAYKSSTSTMSILYGSATGVADGKYNFEVGVTAGAGNSIAAGDLNNDGLPELVVSDNANSQVVVILNLGNRLFESKDINKTYNAGGHPVGLTVSDFDNDGFNDIAVASLDLKSITILRNTLPVNISEATTTTTLATTTSTSSTTTTTIPTNTSITLNLGMKWNLLSSTIGFQVTSVFGTTTFTSVWKWGDDGKGGTTWAVYVPSGDGGLSYAQAKGFVPLTAISSGEGFWVNSKADTQVTISGTPAYGPLSFVSGWNLVGLRGTQTVAVADLGEVSSAWKWTTVNNVKSWALYLANETDKGAAFAAAHGYGLLTTVAPGEGFWVKQP